MLLACAWSWPLFWLFHMEPTLWSAIPLPQPLRMTLLMWGPGLAAMLCWRLFRDHIPRRASLTGGSAKHAIAFYAVPMAALALVGVEIQGPGGVQHVHALVGVIALVGFANSLGEELGWRGFLQDALQPLDPLARYVLIGLLWAAWHFTNLWAGRGDAGDVAIYLAWYLPSTVLYSFLLGTGVERSRALAVACTGHAWINTGEFGGDGMWLVLACSVPFWIWLLRTWPKHELVSDPPIPDR